MFDVEEWRRRGIIWGSALGFTFVGLLIIIPFFTDIDLTANTVLGIFIVSSILAILFVVASQGRIHLGIVFSIVGIIAIFVGFGTLLGFAEYEGVNPITLEYYDKKALWELTDKDISIFTGISAVGIIMFAIGAWQLWNRFVYGWKS